MFERDTSKYGGRYSTYCSNVDNSDGSCISYNSSNKDGRCTSNYSGNDSSNYSADCSSFCFSENSSACFDLYNSNRQGYNSSNRGSQNSWDCSTDNTGEKDSVRSTMRNVHNNGVNSSYCTSTG